MARSLRDLRRRVHAVEEARGLHFPMCVIVEPSEDEDRAVFDARLRKAHRDAEAVRAKGGIAHVIVVDREEASDG